MTSWSKAVELRLEVAGSTVRLRPIHAALLRNNQVMFIAKVVQKTIEGASINGARVGTISITPPGETIHPQTILWDNGTAWTRPDSLSTLEGGSWEIEGDSSNTGGGTNNSVKIEALQGGGYLFTNENGDTSTGQLETPKDKVIAEAWGHLEGHLAGIVYLSETVVPYSDGKSGGDGQEQLYCAGHAFTPEGDFFTAGGNVYGRADKYFSYAYNPLAGTGGWRKVEPESKGLGNSYGDLASTYRYYPSVTLLHDGRMLVTASARLPGANNNEPAATYNISVEAYDPIKREWEIMTCHPDTGQAAIESPWEIAPQGKDVDIYDYPHVFLLPGDPHDARVLMVSSRAVPVILSLKNKNFSTARLSRLMLKVRPLADTSTFPDDLNEFDAAVSNPNGGVSSALLPLRLIDREWGYNNGSVLFVAGNISELQKRGDVYDPKDDVWNAPTDGRGIPLDAKRQHPTIVTLPDGRMLIVNGHGGEHHHDGQDAGDEGASYGVYPNLGHGGEHHHDGPDAGDEGASTQIVEFIDPRGVFSHHSDVSTQKLVRGYHNIALLVPDGRVMVGSGRSKQAGDDERTIIEYYSPDYTTKPRAEITEVFSTISRNEEFRVRWREFPSNPGWGNVAEAVLMGLGSVTHSINMGQRYVQIEVVPQSGSEATLRVPASVNDTYAPCGCYMLFLLNTELVPTIGRIVRLVDFNTADVADVNGAWDMPRQWETGARRD